MTAGGKPLLIDFGLSQIVSDIHGSTYLTSTIGGVARYTPIEHYRELTGNDDDTVSTYSDIYSFGSIMLHVSVDCLQIIYK
jgi:serine/threonine protein kinase